MRILLTTSILLIGTVCHGQEGCPAPIDVNSNAAVDIADFLNVLGLFGDVDSDGDGVWDSQDLCVDPNACNFQANQSEYCQYLDAVGVCGGGCESDDDSDGICDFLECGDPKTYQGYHYATVLIGDQCWFAENLRSETYQNGDSINAPEILSDWSNTTEGAITMAVWTLFDAVRFVRRGGGPWRVRQAVQPPRSRGSPEPLSVWVACALG